MDMNSCAFPTHSGLIVDLERPTPDMIDPDDIAWALAHTLRYGGHSNQPITVANHSIEDANHVAYATADADLVRAGLLHDAAEAYLGDVIRPLKRMMPEYGRIETEFEWVIGKRFDIDPALFSCETVKHADMVVYSLERRDIGPTAWDVLPDDELPSCGHTNRSIGDSYTDFTDLMLQFRLT